MTGRDIASRGRGSRLAAVLPVFVFPLTGVLLVGLFIGLQSTTPPPLADNIDSSFAPTEKFPSPPPPSFITLLSDLSPANSSCGGVNCEDARRSKGDDVDDDEELLRRASSMAVEVGESSGECPRKKVAFMFLTRGRMPLRQLWELFFMGYEGYFSIYIHTSPEFTEQPPERSVFSGRRVPSKPVSWGRASMVDAERRLLANALLNPCNERFVLLSESCIPLFNFTTVYRYLLGSALSFVSAFDDPRKAGRGRYNPRMSPAVTLQDWRKGSQWFAAHRRIAAAVVSDRVYYPVFREHCRPPCYMDEHYVPTLVTKLLPWLNANRSITWVDWSMGGSHPASFRGRKVSRHLIKRVRQGTQCIYNGSSTSTCFLFARKFDGSTLGPLLRMATGVLGFNL